MKKICIFALALLLSVSFAGCGRNNADETQPSTDATTTAPTTAPTTRPTTQPTTTPITVPTIFPTIEPTIETNIPDPDINTEMPDMMS